MPLDQGMILRGTDPATRGSRVSPQPRAGSVRLVREATSPPGESHRKSTTYFEGQAPQHGFSEDDPYVRFDRNQPYDLPQ